MGDVPLVDVESRGAEVLRKKVGINVELQRNSWCRTQSVSTRVRGRVRVRIRGRVRVRGWARVKVRVRFKVSKN